MLNFKKRSSLFSVLVCLTLLSISAQISLFIIHNHAVDLVDSLISSSVPANFFHTAVLLPLIKFLFIQISAYLLFIGFVWFITVSCSEFFNLPAYELGIFFWFIATLAVFMLNNHYFPDSFFAGLLAGFPFKESSLGLSVGILLVAVVLAYYQLVRQRRRIFIGSVFMFFFTLVLFSAGLNYFSTQAKYQLTGSDSRPNIILIGLDSLRPDFTGFLGKSRTATPNIDQFLRTAVTFTDAYTPLARTFPAWISILTAKHPKNSHARINLGYPQPVVANDTLAKELQKAGYETIYATDEKRFSNLTRAYGFDQLLGPGIGLGDFILGGLSDFPLTNLMINLPIGRFIFPYNYANRAAAITYEPDKFLQLVKIGLHQRQQKPLFLAIHFCLPHWPFTWAGDLQKANASADQRYRSSIEQVDKQLGDLLQILKQNGLLQHSLLVLLSDHGTTLGLPGDRLLEKQHYQGRPDRLKWVPVYKMSTASPSSLDLEKNYSLNTAYGQGTDVLSSKQYQVLLAFKYFDLPQRSRWTPQQVRIRSSLLDIAPTILSLLRLSPMKASDGWSLEPYILNSLKTKPGLRPFYLETGHSISEIETNKIEVEKVIQRTINIYELDPQSGYLFVKPSAEKGVLESKQRAVLLGPWLLARYPASKRSKLVKSEQRANTLDTTDYILPAYYVLANIKTGAWTIGFDTALAKQAPLAELQRRFKAFYGDELTS